MTSPFIPLCSLLSYSLSHTLSLSLSLPPSLPPSLFLSHGFSFCFLSFLLRASSCPLSLSLTQRGSLSLSHFFRFMSLFVSLSIPLFLSFFLSFSFATLYPICPFLSLFLSFVRSFSFSLLSRAHWGHFPLVQPCDSENISLFSEAKTAAHTYRTPTMRNYFSSEGSMQLILFHCLFFTYPQLRIVLWIFNKI